MLLVRACAPSIAFVSILVPSRTAFFWANIFASKILFYIFTRFRSLTRRPEALLEPRVCSISPQPVLIFDGKAEAALMMDRAL